MTLMFYYYKTKIPIGILSDNEFSRDIMVVFATSGIVVWIFLSGKEISKAMGLFMILTYLSYMTYLSGLLW